MQDRPWTRHYDTWVPTTLRYPRVPVQELLRGMANQYPDKSAAVFYGSQTSFRQLRLASLQMAAALAGLGVARGDRVALHLPNCPQYLIAFYAALHLGAIVVNVNPLYTVPELRHMAQLTRPKVLFTFDLFLDNVRKLVQEVEPPTVVVTAITDFIEGVGRSTAQSLNLEAGWRHFSDLLEGAAGLKPPRVQINAEDPAVIIFTGGTTGVPKGAVLSHYNYVSAATVCAAWGEGTNRLLPVERRSVMTVLPFFHIYGQICCLQYAMYTGATMYLVPRFDLDEFMNTLAGIKEIGFFPAVPTMINAIVNHPRAAQMELDKKIKLINSGAGPMPVELIGQVEDLGIAYSEGWGMTETTSLGAANPIMGLSKHGSIGLPFIDAEIKLVDVETGQQEVPPGQPGEMIIRAPYVMQGYWDNPQETAGQLKDGWLFTGDIAAADEDGYLFIVDRKKDMIIAGGYNIYPREIDEVLYMHPQVAEAVALGVPDQYRGETVKAFVVLKPGQSADAEDIIAFCRQHLAAYKAPKLVEFRDSLPKSAVGKLLRKVLRAEEEAKQKARARS
ncbi:MAG: long-chain fatty acid--CoA ligase [Desulfarculus sp.]|nr:MAG: long-chain fatty acid--CoA ligase [Desulfarculus sp.]